MENSRISWIKLGLVALPGIWLALNPRTEILSPVTNTVVSFVVVIILATALVTISVFTERRLAIWCLPLVGILLWTGAETNEQLEMANRMGWIDYRHIGAYVLLIYGLTVLVLVILLPIWIFKIRERIPKLVWSLGGILVVNGIFFTFIAYGIYGPPFFIPDLLFLILPIAIGWAWANKYGLTAGVVVVAMEPYWVRLLADPRILIYDSPPSDLLTMALIAISSLQALAFFAAIPIGLLCARSDKAKMVWLILGPLLCIGLIYGIVGIALIATRTPIGPLVWVETLLATTLLWLPILITAILYRSKYLHKQTMAELG